MKRFLFVVFILSFVLLFAATGMADTEGDWTYTVSGINATVTGYSGSSPSVVIPSTLGGNHVTAVGTRAFRNNTAIESVVIPTGVTSIGTQAFQGCSALTDVTIPDSVTDILGQSFGGTALQQVKVPAETNITGNAFPDSVLLLIPEYDSITAANIASIFNYIEYEPVQGGIKIYVYSTKENIIAVPETLDGQAVVDIDHNAFDGGKKLIADLSGTVAEILTDYGYVIYDPADLTMGLRKINGVVYLAEYDGTEASVTIPASVDAISEYAFNGNNTVTSITIPASVSSIEANAFTGASALTEIHLPGNLTYIDSSAFPYALDYFCGRNTNTAKALGNAGYSFIDPDEPDFQMTWTSSTTLQVTAYLGRGSLIAVPEGVHHIGPDVFKNNTAITSVTLPSTLSTIHAGAFLNVSGLTTIELPAGLTTIETLAFYGTGLTDIDIPDGLTTIRSGAAPGNLNSINYYDGDGYTSLPEGCFVHTTLGSTASHTLSDAGYTVYVRNDNTYGCRYIDGYLYLIRYNGEEDVINVPEGIEGVAYVFGVYNKMTGVVFPSTLKVIGYEAFKNCSGLTSITIPSTVIEIGYEAFAGSALRSIKLPDNVRTVGYGAFMDCTNLASATFVVSGKNGLNSIGESAFQNTGLRSVSIPKTTVSIGNNAFAENAHLTTVTLPTDGSLTTIGSYAFQGTAVKNITIPGTAETVGPYAFANCYSLTTATLAEGVQTIDYGAFQDDHQLQTVTLNNGVKTIGNCAFYNCSALSSINIPSGVTSIGEWAFFNNRALTGIVLPDTVTHVAQYAFQSANLSQGITLSGGMTTIESYTFQYSSLTGITIPDSVTSIGAYAFENCDSLTGITLSSTLRTIGVSAFDNCTVLSWLELPGSMTSLNKCLDNCTSAIVVLPDSIKYINGIVFDDVRAVLGSRNNDILKSLDRFGYNDERTFVYTYIDDDGIEDYSTLRVVDFIGNGTTDTLPSGVKVIKDGAFARCGLTELTLPDTGLTTIGEHAFPSLAFAKCTPGSDTEELLIRAGYADMNGFTYNIDGNSYTATGYAGNEREIILPARASAIGNNAFETCTGTRKLTLPDNGLTEIGRNAFHDGLQVICTTGSATHALLVAGGYPVEIDGYPGLYAVARDGKLYNARYTGNASIIDLPDNIASTLPYGEEVIGEYDPDTYTWVSETVSHPMMFPTTTRYRTSFDTLTAQTLGYYCYYITVAGYEDFGFRQNRVFVYDGYEAGDVYLDDTTVSDDAWYATLYYGTDLNPAIPEGIDHICLDEMSINAITISRDQVNLTIVNNLNREIYISEYPDFVFGSTGRYQYVTDLRGQSFTGWYLKNYTGSANEITLDDQFPVSHIINSCQLNNVKVFLTTSTGLSQQFVSQDYYLTGYPDFAMRYDEYGPYVYRYTGTTKEIVIDDIIGYRIAENAFPSDTKLFISANTSIWPHETADPAMFADKSYYIAGYPEIEMRTSADMTWEGIYRYTGSSKEIHLGDDFGAPNHAFSMFPNAIPGDVEVYCTLSCPAASMFTDSSFLAEGYEDFEYRCDPTDPVAPSYPLDIYLYAYTGTDTEIRLPDGSYSIRNDAFPSTVSRIHFDGYEIADPEDWPGRTLRNIKIMAEVDSPFVTKLCEYSGMPGVYGLRFSYIYPSDYPDVAYEVCDGSVRLLDYMGSEPSVILPGYFSDLSDDIFYEQKEYYVNHQDDGYFDSDGNWVSIEPEPFNPFGKPIYVYPGTQTAALLEGNRIPFNERQTIRSTLPGELTTIEDEAFMGCLFNEVTIGSKCTGIGARAFANSRELIAIHIPRSVRNIDVTAFTGCTQLKIYCKSGSVAETFARNNGIPYANE